MRRYFLLRWLVLPLGVAAAVAMSIALCLRDPWSSLLINLAATFLGSIVTVLFIDTILRRNEEQRWERVRGQVGRQVTILANGFTSSVRTALKIRPPDTWMDPNLFSDPARMREAMIELIERDVLPAISDLQRMDQAAWRIFAANLSGGMLHCDRLISLFGSNLDPQITGLILDLHERAGAVLSPYEIFPDMLGVPFEQLKPNRCGESGVPLMQAMMRQVIRDTEQLLQICVSLLRQIRQRFPEAQRQQQKADSG